MRLSTVLVLLYSQAAPAADRPAAWKSTRTVSAAEAHQAAAADDSYFYAVTNARIAKIDRKIGKRVAISTGQALHLNSAFFWNGRLYCAHSNYPRSPEQSQIKVLDVETMKLSTFHDFGDAGGSLTWVVRRGGSWWCNFAYYGDDNARTYLAKFDDDWQELERWTYPAAIVKQLGRYSLSGGVWRGDDLLVTGHDDPVLFRLRLPNHGNELELVDQQSSPFSGQGFAVDPRTGGLVGIHRAKRQVVFAVREPADRLRVRVLTYNIHHGEGIDGRLDLERIADVIKSVEPDVVALQEVDVKTNRTNRVDQAAELGRLTRMHSIFGPNIDFGGGEYGNAVLSRFKIAGSVNHKLPSFDDGEQRGVLEVELNLPEGFPNLFVYATHLDHRQKDRERRESAKRIIKLAGDHKGRPALLAGDLNDSPDSATLSALVETWTRTNERPAPTVPVGKPKRQIDYVLFRPKNRWTVVETRVLKEAVASDHRAVLAILELKVE